MIEAIEAGGSALQWPALNWQDWRETAETLHMLTQIVGKTRLGLTCLQNHWWNVPLYVSSRGLSTSAMPLAGASIEIEFDFIAHEVVFRRSTGQVASIALKAQSVKAFFAQYLETLSALAVPVTIQPLPVECPDPIRFDQDTVHCSYDAHAAHRFWRILERVNSLFREFSGRFYGKISPVHFFWGSFDLAVTRFNGKRAPARAGADAIQAEAYSHECISAGFWPGNGGYGQAAFYCYAAPVPELLAETQLAGAGGFNRQLGEFLLNYDEVLLTSDPRQTILGFLETTYAACADAAQWDRAQLDRKASPVTPKSCSVNSLGKQLVR